MRKFFLTLFIFAVIYCNVYPADKIEQIYNEYYMHGRFAKAIEELRTLYSHSTSNRDKILFLLAKCYYKTKDFYNTYNSLEQISKYQNKSSIVKEGDLFDTIIKMLELESRRPNFDYNFAVNLVMLMEDINIFPDKIEYAKSIIRKKSLEKIWIDIGFKNRTVSNYNRFIKLLANKIWDRFFYYNSVENPLFEMQKRISEKQIEDICKYYSKKLLIKIIIKQYFQTQIVKYNAFGKIKTSFKEFLDVINVDLNRVFSGDMDNYIIKEKL